MSKVRKLRLSESRVPSLLEHSAERKQLRRSQLRQSYGNSLTTFLYKPYFTFSTIPSSWKRMMAREAACWEHPNTSMNCCVLNSSGSLRKHSIDEVPEHVEHTCHRLLIGIHLSVLLIVERLQLKDFAVLPVTALVLLGDVIQFRIKREHVEVQGLTLNGFNGCIHVADKFSGCRSGRMHSDAYHRPFQGFTSCSKAPS